MSDASATATAIPREINLGLQKPVATPAYTRRFKSNASTPVVSAGSQVTITLDTAQPGSFIDTLSSYLSFKLQLRNTNVNQGYNVSFSAAGAHALFRAMRIYVQGVPIEEITEYNALVEWLHDLTGIPDYSDRSAKSRYFSNTMLDDQTIYVPPATATQASERVLNIQLPLVSGVLGTMAEKMFPSMLVAPGNCYIQLDVAQTAHALRVVEVDVSQLVVGTAPVAAVEALELVGTAAGPAVNTKLMAYESYGAGAVAAQVTGLTGDTILEDGPFDVPYKKQAANTAQGVLTTEERIGGGMWWAGTGAYAEPGNALDVSDDVSGQTNAFPIAVSAISTVQSSPNVFLGAGVGTAGGADGQALNRVSVPSSTQLTFNIIDLEYVGKQVVVGDDVARAIIERAASGDISIHTQSYRQYPATIGLTSGWVYRVGQQYQNLSTIAPSAGAPLVNMYERYNRPGGQSIIIPAKISSANAIYHIFRNGQAENNFMFDSLRRMTIGFTDVLSPTGAGVTAQLRIGNELIPQSPIQSANECLEELLKAHHMGGHYGTTEKMGSLVCSAAQYAWPELSSFMKRRGVTTNSLTACTAAAPAIGRTTESDPGSILGTGGVYWPRNDFNAQILCPNPVGITWKFPAFADYNVTLINTAAASGKNFLRPLGYNGTGAAPAANDGASSFYTSTSIGRQNYLYGQVTAVSEYAESQEDYAFRQRRWKDAVKKAFFGYADERSDHQLTDPTKPNFMNPYKQHTGRYSTFMLGFDLDTFSHNSDTVRSGHYLGNNTVSLNLSAVEFVDNSPMNMPLCTSVRMDTFVLHDLRLSFQAGGIVQAFY
jgi:hypothetical protein